MQSVLIEAVRLLSSYIPLPVRSRYINLAAVFLWCQEAGSWPDPPVCLSPLGPKSAPGPLSVSDQRLQGAPISDRNWSPKAARDAVNLNER